MKFFGRNSFLRLCTHCNRTQILAFVHFLSAERKENFNSKQSAVSLLVEEALDRSLANRMSYFVRNSRIHFSYDGSAATNRIANSKIVIKMSQRNEFCNKYWNNNFAFIRMNLSTRNPIRISLACIHWNTVLSAQVQQATRKDDIPFECNFQCIMPMSWNARVFFPLSVFFQLPLSLEWMAF